MAVAQRDTEQSPPADLTDPRRRSRTPEDRPVVLCPNCFLAMPAATQRCEFCE